jgi:hypothetical protein
MTAHITAAAGLDVDSAEWPRALAGTGPPREEALARLHGLLVRIAHGEVARRGPRLQLSGPELDDLAYQSAADALVAITSKLGQFRGESRFTTWACKFVIFEVSAKIGRHFWRHPSVPFDAEDWLQPLPRYNSPDRRYPATRACRGTLADASEKVVAEGSGAAARLEAAAPCQVPGARCSGSVAGNEVGITGARKCALPLYSAHLRARFTCRNTGMAWSRGCGCFPGGQGVAGSNPAVPTGFFERLCPELGTKTAMIVPTRPAGISKASKPGGHAILIIASPQWPRSRRGGRLGICLPQQARAGLDQHARAEQPCPAPEPARASRQPKQYSYGAEPTGRLTLTPGVRVDHHPDEHGALLGPALRGGRQWRARRRGNCYMTRGDGSRQDECRPLTGACLQLLGHRT